jgi:hypothetical protein
VIGLSAVPESLESRTKVEVLSYVPPLNHTVNPPDRIAPLLFKERTCVLALSRVRKGLFIVPSPVVSLPLVATYIPPVEVTTGVVDVGVQLFPLMVYPLLHEETLHEPNDDHVPLVQVLDCIPIPFEMVQD